MSIYYKIACHTCKTQLDMAGSAMPTREWQIGMFAHKHAFHDIMLVHDSSIDEDDDQYNKVMDYEEEN